MPYFKWSGVDIIGAPQSGKYAAYSEKELAEHLFSRGIALLNSKKIYTPSLLWRITAQTKANIFKHMATLLRAGIVLPQVLDNIAQQSNNPFIYDTFFVLSRDIQSGVPFAIAIMKDKKIDDPLVTTMLIAGYDSGRLADAAENAVDYYQMHHLFIKNIRSVLAMPLLTLFFFIGISLFIFIVIIPRFAQMFASLHHELPPLTRFMIDISDFILSGSMVIVFFGVIALIGMLWYYFMHNGKNVGTYIVMKIPFVGQFVRQHHYAQIFYALSLLVKSGISVVPALENVIHCIDNYQIKKQCIVLYNQLLSGYMLSDVMINEGTFFPEVCTLIRIGEKSGTLSNSLTTVAQLYNDAMQQSMKRFIFFLQPLVIILLGFLITLLIFAVYMPILQLSYVV